MKSKFQPIFFIISIAFLFFKKHEAYAQCGTLPTTMPQNQIDLAAANFTIPCAWKKILDKAGFTSGVNSPMAIKVRLYKAN